MENKIFLRGPLGLGFRVGALALFFWVSAAENAGAQTYRGRVVDAETGKPLEGAVVTVIWFRRPKLAMDSVSSFFDAKEALTDAAGSFSMDVTPPSNWNPFLYVVKEPWIVVFKPGYAPLTNMYAIERGISDPPREFAMGSTVRLPKLKTREEMLEFVDRGALGIGVNTPSYAIRNLIRALNQQRTMLSLPPIS